MHLKHCLGAWLHLTIEAEKKLNVSDLTCAYNSSNDYSVIIIIWTIIFFYLVLVEQMCACVMFILFLFYFFHLELTMRICQIHNDELNAIKKKLKPRNSESDEKN